MRILCHGQHLTGVGHFIRLRAIARGLAPEHEVHLTDGGRPLPPSLDSRDPALLPLPRLVRVGGRLTSFQSGTPVADILARRVKLLTTAVRRLRPHVVIVDHYPFSRWEFDDEIRAVIGAARRAYAGVLTVCSVRDNVLTSYERAPAVAYEAGVAARLGELFDELFVHADPGFMRLDVAFPGGAPLPPQHYTGFVVDPPPAPLTPARPAPHAVLSCGGTIVNREFLLAAIAAFKALHAGGALGGLTIEVFPGPAAPTDLAAVREAAGEGGPFRVHDFSPDFHAYLIGCALSISRAGYNTAFQVVAAGVPSVLVPNPNQPDQVIRARRLGELGLATVVERDTDAGCIAEGIRDALARPRPQHALDLGGVATTRSLLEKLAAGR